MDIEKCLNCGINIMEGLQICPECMKKAGAGKAEVEAAEELRDITNILNITAGTDFNTKMAIQSILNIAGRLERREEK